MKLHLLVLLSVAIPAFADTPPLPLAEQVVEAAGVKASVEASFMQGMESAMQQFRQNGGDELATTASEIVRKFYVENFKWEDVRPIFGQSYSAEYSESELKELLAFFQSPIGKKMAEKSTKLGSSTAVLMREKLKDKMPKLQSELISAVRAHMDKVQKGAK